MTSFKQTFSIVGFCAWGFGEPKDQKDHPGILTESTELKNLSPMVKRRMPKLCKYIYEVIQHLNAQLNNSKMPLIYASKNAELNRTFKIIRSFDSDISPLQFSMSVHNAIAGLLSVINKDASTYTVIDSLSGPLETALIEAIALLSHHPLVKIVYFDENLPDELNAHFPNQNNPIVLSLTIKKGMQTSLTMSQGTVAHQENFTQLFDFFSHQTNQYQHDSGRLMWEWNHHASH